jgi:hypothetical protein
MAGAGEPVVLQLGYEAAAAMLAFEAELEPLLAPGSGDLAYIADWASKLAGAVARIAGLLHLADQLHRGWGHPIELGIMQDALTLGRYLADHALIAFEQMGADASLDDARYLLEWIERTGSERFTGGSCSLRCPVVGSRASTSLSLAWPCWRPTATCASPCNPSRRAPAGPRPRPMR